MTLVSGGFSGAAVSQRTRRCDADHNASRKQPHFWVEFAQVPCGQRLPRLRERDWARGQTTSITEWGAFDPLVIDCYHNGAGWSSLVARWAHNPKVGGSNPPPATITGQRSRSQLIENRRPILFLRGFRLICGPACFRPGKPRRDQMLNSVLPYAIAISEKMSTASRRHSLAFSSDR